MQSNNPVFRRSEEFSRSGAAYQGYGQQGYQGYAPSPTGYGDPVPAPPTTGRTGVMTIDTVVQSTAITLGVILLTAAATWVLTPGFDDPNAIGVIGGFATYALSVAAE